MFVQDPPSSSCFFPLTSLFTLLTGMKTTLRSSKLRVQHLTRLSLLHRMDTTTLLDTRRLPSDSPRLVDRSTKLSLDPRLVGRIRSMLDF